MVIKYCRYCGGDVNQCDCEREAEEERLALIEEHQNRLDVQLGWSQQDAIDTQKYER